MSRIFDRVQARYVTTADAGAASGAVVVVDVLRAFTTAAYALAAGARHVLLVASVEEALAIKAADPAILAMGEQNGQDIELAIRVDAFDFAMEAVRIDDGIRLERRDPRR